MGAGFQWLQLSIPLAVFAVGTLAYWAVAKQVDLSGAYPSRSRGISLTYPCPPEGHAGPVQWPPAVHRIGSAATLRNACILLMCSNTEF